MFNKPLAIHKYGYVYIYEKLDVDYRIEDELSKFATLIKTPTFIHTYKIDEYSLWSAALMELKSENVISFLEENSINEVPENIRSFIRKIIKDFWTMEIYIDDRITLSGNEMAVSKLQQDKRISDLIVSKSKTLLCFNRRDLYKLRKFVTDHNVFLVEVCENERFCNLNLRPEVELYPYQLEAFNEFEKHNRGVILMPPGSGKTIVGLKVIEHYKFSTLIFVKEEKSYDIWREEILSKTNLVDNDISYNKIDVGKKVNIYTYEKGIRDINNFDFTLDWGLIIYDDANNLPAKKSQELAFIPSKHKLAMDSLLSRSDNNEHMIYKTIGAKVYNLTLKKMEVIYHQAKVTCIQIKVPYNPWDNYNEDDENHTVSKSDAKVEAFEIIDRKHRENNKVMISYYKSVSHRLGNMLNIQVVNGDNPNIRNEVVDSFNNKIIDKIIFTKVIEKQPLKNIDVLISLSYHGGTERDEYIRIGKLKSSNGFSDKKVYYYALVSRETKEEEFYFRRRNFMINHGYEFKITTLEDLRRDSSEV